MTRKQTGARSPRLLAACVCRLHGAAMLVSPVECHLLPGVVVTWLSPRGSLTTHHLTPFPAVSHHHTLSTAICCHFISLPKQLQATVLDLFCAQKVNTLLTDLQLSLNAAFALIPERHLGLAVRGHDFHKATRQHWVLQTQTDKENKECKWLWWTHCRTFVNLQTSLDSNLTLVKLSKSVL